MIVIIFGLIALFPPHGVQFLATICNVGCLSEAAAPVVVRKGEWVMALTLATRSLRCGVAVATLAGLLLALAPTDASAQYRRRGPGAGAVAAGVVGGLALGALAAGAARPYYYGPSPYYYGPGPAYVVEDELPPPPRYRPRCWFEREDVWDGYGYVPRRIRVCR